jgi:hypothetical protein
VFLYHNGPFRKLFTIVGAADVDGSVPRLYFERPVARGEADRRRMCYVDQTLAGLIRPSTALWLIEHEAFTMIENLAPYLHGEVRELLRRLQVLELLELTAQWPARERSLRLLLCSESSNWRINKDVREELQFQCRCLVCDALLARGEGLWQSLILRGVRFRRNGNIHVRPNSRLALPRHT